MPFAAPSCCGPWSWSRSCARYGPGPPTALQVTPEQSSRPHPQCRMGKGVIRPVVTILPPLSQGIKKPFTEVVRANIGDAQAMGQKPITFLRQVRLVLPLCPSPVSPVPWPQRSLLPGLGPLRPPGPPEQPRLPCGCQEKGGAHPAGLRGPQLRWESEPGGGAGTGGRLCGRGAGQPAGRGGSRREGC